MSFGKRQLKVLAQVVPNRRLRMGQKRIHFIEERTIMAILADDTVLIKFYESRVKTHSTFQNSELWLNDDLEMLKAIKDYVNTATFVYLESLIKKALETT